MSIIQIDSLNSKPKDSTKAINLEIKDPSDIKIWLIDPTYTQQQISSESMPAAIGGIATFTEKHLKLRNSIRLFKYPEKLIVALEREIPDVIGFSNYMWNSELSLAIARRIKEYAADTIIVMGGPNYPVVPSEQELFLRNHPEIDFYIKGEGEVAFANLIAELIRSNMKKNSLTHELPSVHYISSENKAMITSYVERVKDLTEIPSPYLEGKMDEFFDGKLQPVIQTTRGCPFSCTFCVEGMSYYSKIYRNNQEKIRDELNYIGSKMQQVRKKGGRNDLWLVDSNFGMYSEDLETCKSIAECQSKFQWPEYVQCDTGKNNKPRVLNAARLVKGAIRLSGSVQTLDKDVLKNIKRSNISGEGLMQLAIEAAEIDADSRSEIILGLPGESLSSHFETIKTIIDARFNHVNTYQLMMLPGTEIYSPSTRNEYEIKTRYRILPRCFGYYEILGKQVIAAEIEEVCISTKTLSFEDYVKCRKMHLLIHLYHNDGLFSTVLEFIKFLKLSPYDWLEQLFNEKITEGVAELFKKFEDDTRQELWLKREDLIQNIQKPGIVDSYISGELGYNLLFVHKAIAISRFVTELKKFAKLTLVKLLSKNHLDTQDNLDFLNDVLNYDSCCISNIFENLDSIPETKINYDVEKFKREKISSISELRLNNPVSLKFILNDEQIDILKRSLELYTSSDIGISRILTKIFVKKILRTNMSQNTLKKKME